MNSTSLTLIITSIIAVVSLVAVLLTQQIFSKSTDECNKNRSNEDLNDIDVIAKDLDISSCEAGAVFDYIIKGNEIFNEAINFEVNSTFSEEKCNENCNIANEKLKNSFKNYNVTLISERSQKFLTDEDYLKVCENKCKKTSLNLEILVAESKIEEFYEDEIVEDESIEHEIMEEESLQTESLETESLENESKVEDETESELINLHKRASKKCSDKSKAEVRYILTKSDGFKQYQDKGKVKTALSEANGCGPKKNKIQRFFVQKLAYANEFTPACNSHDVCYACQKGKKSCDDLFKKNMYKVCAKLYETKKGDSAVTKALKKLSKLACEEQADLFKKGVSKLGNDAYKSSFDTASKCAECGVNIIKNTLVNTPFYVKK